MIWDEQIFKLLEVDNVVPFLVVIYEVFITHELFGYLGHCFARLKFGLVQFYECFNFDVLAAWRNYSAQAEDREMMRIQLLSKKRGGPKLPCRIGSRCRNPPQDQPKRSRQN